MTITLTKENNGSMLESVGIELYEVNIELNESTLEPTSNQLNVFSEDGEYIWSINYFVDNTPYIIEFTFNSDVKDGVSTRKLVPRHAIIFEEDADPIVDTFFFDVETDEYD